MTMIGGRYVRPEDMPFFKKQQKIVLENCGIIDPQEMDEYVGVDGYQGLYAGLAARAVSAQRGRQVLKSGLRGRGGGGFQTGKKWELLASAPGPDKYVICNGDEGDPGTLMDRSVLESDPHRVIEGMIITAHIAACSTCGPSIRWPSASSRMASDQARQAGTLGERMLGSDFSFDAEIRVGTAPSCAARKRRMIASVEGNTASRGPVRRSRRRRVCSASRR